MPSPPWPRPIPQPLALALELQHYRAVEERVEDEPLLLTWTGWPAVVVGRMAREGLDYDCREAGRLGVPVYRRPSGGGAVVHGPGVLIVTLIEPVEHRPPPHTVYRRGTAILTGALARLGVEARVANEGDIVVGGWKVGGSAALIGPRATLYHAILTVDEPLIHVHRLTPPRRDLIAQGRVDPVKYRPARLVDLAPQAARHRVIQAIAAEAEARGLTLQHITGVPAPYPDRLYEVASEMASSPRWRPCRGKDPQGTSREAAGR